MKHPKILLSLASLCVAFGASAQNIFMNPGFELGTGIDADSWNELGGLGHSVERDGSSPASGDWAMRLSVDFVNNPSTAAATFIQQVTPVGTVNDALNYNLTFDAKVTSLDFTGINIFYKLVFLDQDGSDGGGVKGEILTPFVASLTTNYTQISLLNYDAPAGADSAELIIQLAQGPVDNIQNTLFVDNVSLAPVPEPSTYAALTGALVFGLAVWRRRRR
jgi:hypothetical protein